MFMLPICIESPAGRKSGYMYKLPPHISSIKPLRIEARPTVSMITYIRGSPIRGRRNSFSIIKPNAKLLKSVKRKAMGIGRFAHTVRVRNMKAPAASSSPWAKLRTLEDLKIITNPMAARP
jgi:hypothetical protein